MSTTHLLRNARGVDRAFKLKAGIIRVLSDHGINPSRPVVEDLAGYILTLMEYDPTNRVAPAVVDTTAETINKEIWNDAEQQREPTYPPTYSYRSRKRS